MRVPQPDQVDLWLSCRHVCSDTDRQSRLAVLDPAERLRYANYASTTTRDRFLVGRSLLRTVLSGYWPLAPSAWRFATEQDGRPVLATETGVPPLHFSVTHTAGLTALAIASSAEVGVDAERLDVGSFDPAELALRLFSPEDAARVARQAAGQPAAAAFLTIWTLKEAYGKARGLGLLLPLAGTGFEVAGPSVAVSFGAQVKDDPATWAFRSFEPTPDHVVSVAKRRPPSRSEVEVTLRWV